jgi:hypothetical protein
MGSLGKEGVEAKAAVGTPARLWRRAVTRGLFGYDHGADLILDAYHASGYRFCSPNTRKRQ